MEKEGFFWDDFENYYYYSKAFSLKVFLCISYYLPIHYTFVEQMRVYSLGFVEPCVV
jgi:hypothetical protein